MNGRDFYEVLGIGKGASEDDIRKVYRKLAMDWHPDRNNTPEAEQRFKEINEAYQTLSDPQKRQMYDRYGRVAVSDAGRRGFEGFDPGGGLGDIFEAFFSGFGVREERGPRRGGDLHYAITISFQEAAFGLGREIDAARTELCTRCKGNRAEPGTSLTQCNTCRGNGQVRRTQSNLFGQFMQVVPCPTCKGEGRIVQMPCAQCKGAGREQRTRKLQVAIPAGIEDGTQVRLSGEGDAGWNSGPPGHFYLSVTVKAHPFFKREGNHLIYEMPITFPQAALGDMVDVPLLGGAIDQLKIPSGTQPGTVLRIKGKGVTDVNSRQRGDLLVVVQVTTPKKLDARTKKLLEELHKLLEPEHPKQSVE
ncbi:MAG: molecular chaperone DnaJ [Dehalococcoidia bacterium]|nr:molecular chaperone DnaJ [Dehalococcoidia bacterium]